MVPAKLVKALKQKSNKTFLVSSHIHLEGDALGSELAVAGLLESLGKKVILLNEDTPPSAYAFMPGLKKIKQNSIGADYDVAVLVDCSDISRIGRIRKFLKPGKPIINIDHHISNTCFGDINWIDADACCACEMI